MQEVVVIIGLKGSCQGYILDERPSLNRTIRGLKADMPWCVLCKKDLALCVVIYNVTKYCQCDDADVFYAKKTLALCVVICGIMRRQVMGCAYKDLGFGLHELSFLSNTVNELAFANDIPAKKL